MKILKIFGIVVGIHVFALILIFANPGCSSSTKPPLPADTATVAAPSPAMVMPSAAPASPSPTTSPASSPAIGFNPDAPAVGASSSSSPGVRYTPTRPGTPVATTLVTEPVPDVMPATTYTIKSGDSLWTVAKKHNLTVAQLAAANNLQASAKLQPGQKLLIPGKPASPATAATTAPSPAPTKSNEPPAARPANANAANGGQLKHTVKNGEALSTIAKTYGVSLKDLAIANNIPDPAKVKAGTELVIPGWDATPTKAGKSGKSSSAKSGGAPAATKAAPVAPPTVNVDTPPAQPGPPPVPVIDIERGSPIVPAPKGP